MVLEISVHVGTNDINLVFMAGGGGVLIAAQGIHSDESVLPTRIAAAFFGDPA